MPLRLYARQWLSMKHDRNDGLLTFRDGTVTFDNLDQLVKLAGFDKAYLDYEGPMLK